MAIKVLLNILFRVSLKAHAFQHLFSVPRFFIVRAQKIKIYEYTNNIKTGGKHGKIVFKQNLDFLGIVKARWAFRTGHREKRRDVFLRAQPFLKALQAVFEQYF